MHSLYLAALINNPTTIHKQHLIAPFSCHAYVLVGLRLMGLTACSVPIHPSTHAPRWCDTQFKPFALHTPERCDGEAISFQSIAIRPLLHIPTTIALAQMC